MKELRRKRRRLHGRIAGAGQHLELRIRGAVSLQTLVSALVVRIDAVRLLAGKAAEAFSALKGCLSRRRHAATQTESPPAQDV